MVIASLAGPDNEGRRIPFTKVAKLMKAAKVRKLTLVGDTVQGVRANGTRFISRKEPGVSLIAALRTLGVSRERLNQTAIRASFHTAPG